MTKKIFFSFIFFIFSGILFSACSSKRVNSSTASSSPEVVPASPSVATPSPKVLATVTYSCQKAKTAFDLLAINKHKVEFKQESFGKLVTSIDGKSQEDGKYWLYSIDDKEATVGADAYTCQGQEKITWELK
jgi:hypothetical protein